MIMLQKSFKKIRIHEGPSNPTYARWIYTLGLSSLFSGTRRSSMAAARPRTILGLSFLVLALLLISTTTLAKSNQSHNQNKSNSSSSEIQWQILTKNNFSSQIQSHSLSLLFVTVPWCGESRSLMKELAHRVALMLEKLGGLRLMVVYRNNDKLVADFLGAADGISVFFYHHSVAYRYRGRLRTQNILTSVVHMMSLELDELPLKPLRTVKELDAFLQSTDKAVLLLESCGWTPRLLHKRKDNDRESVFRVQEALTNGGLRAENFSNGVNQTLPLGEKENQKGLKIEGLTCGVENEFNGLPWLGGFNGANDTSFSHHNENRGHDDQVSCTLEEFQRFESFFSNFIAVVSEHFLPPERQRYGLISKRSLLSHLDVTRPDTWSLMLLFAGCPNCSKLLHKHDDAKSILLVNNKLALELEGEGNSLEPVLPGNKPSIILFVDRSSESSKVRKKSKLALEIFRKLSLSYQTIEQNDNTSESKQTLFVRKIISDRPGTKNLSPTHRMVKFKDKMAYVVVSEDGNIAINNMASGTQGIQEILDLLLQQKNPLLPVKEVKISSLTKEVGFQLLSDDFEVKLLNEIPPQEEHTQPESFLSSELANPNLKTKVENVVHSNTGDSSSPSTIVAVGDGNQLKSVDTETSLKHNQENTAYGEGHTKLLYTESAEKAKEGELNIVESVGIEGKGPLDTGELSSPLTIVSEGDENRLKSVDSETSLKQNQENTAYEEVNSQLLITESAKEAKEGELHTVKSVSHKTSINDASQLINSSVEFLEQDSLSSGVLPLEVHIRKDSGQHSEYSSDIVSYIVDSVVDRNVLPEQTHPVKADRKVEEHHIHNRIFSGSFFFSDGGYRLLGSMTVGSRIPSVVIVDPILQKHYVFPEEAEFSYSSLANFVGGFINGSLLSFQRVQSIPASPRETPHPPFINMDFRETDSIPQVTLGTFSELVLGFNKCDKGYTQSCSNNKNIGPAWKKDVLVLFSNAWCGFCQRMELVVREVYRALKGYKTMLRGGSDREKSSQRQDKLEDTSLNEFPSIFLMDCSLNDCGEILQSLGQMEVFPTLMIFPAETKSAIPYKGHVSVSNIIEFIAALGSNSRELIGKKGILWSGSQGGYRSMGPMQEASSGPVHEQNHVRKNEEHENLLDTAPKLVDKSDEAQSHKSFGTNEGDQQVNVGSVLVATDKLLNAPPFNNSTILIVKAAPEEGFLGLITNKHIEWNVFQGLDKEVASLKQAPLSFGGPVVVPSMPLVSFSRKATEVGYSEIKPSIHYGDHMATFRAIEGIKSGNLSAIDYWFFLGYSSWGWNQLFAELAEGSWETSNLQMGQLDWPES